MADIRIDRNKRFDIISALAAHAASCSSPEQQIHLASIESLCAHVDGELELIAQTKAKNLPRVVFEFQRPAASIKTASPNKRAAKKLRDGLHKRRSVARKPGKARK